MLERSYISFGNSRCRFNLRMLLGVCLAFACASSTMAFAAPAGWNPTWSDEFTGTQVDTSKWDRINWNNPFNNELQAYHESRATVSGGNLVLTADGANFGGKSYTSGKVESVYRQQHGRWEIRAKLPGTLGTWPAIWLLPATEEHGWPSQGEIDIMENRGHQPHLTSSALHWGPDFHGREFRFNEQKATNGGQAENYHNEFHTYAVEWDTSKIRFFVDDVHHYTLTNEETANAFYPGGFLAQQTAPMELNLNVAVGGDFLGSDQPNGSSSWPQQMLVDYVRVYERDSMPPPVVFQNGSFEEQGGSLAGWGTFGNVHPNVQTGHETAAFDGSEALKLYGQFNGGQNYSGAEQGISVSPGDSISASARALVRSADDIVGGNTAVMKFDYYSDFGGKYGTSSYLGSSPTTLLANASTANDTWLNRSLTHTAPAGSVEARLVLVFSQPGLDGGALHIDDVDFLNLDLEFNADANGDGDVDGADFLTWQRNVGRNDATSVASGDYNYDGIVDGDDFAVWLNNYGGNSALSASATQVPEPSSALLAIAFMPVLMTHQAARPRLGSRLLFSSRRSN